MKLPGCIELTHNYGSEKEEGKVYNTGNSDPTGSTNNEKVRGGFGHLGITVPDVYEACERFKKMGCEFTKTPNSGGMKGLAFVKDPDGYLIEILPQVGACVGTDDHQAARLQWRGGRWGRRLQGQQQVKRLARAGASRFSSAVRRLSNPPLCYYSVWYRIAESVRSARSRRSLTCAFTVLPLFS